jgi:hypothetical protein
MDVEIGRKFNAREIAGERAHKRRHGLMAQSQSPRATFGMKIMLALFLFSMLVYFYLCIYTN